MIKIAFMGIRGVPASYSGFETFIESLSRVLVKFGHEVTVYNRSSHVKDIQRSYYGIKIVNLPTVKSKFLDTFVHTFLSVIHALFCNYDIIYICGVGNSLLTGIPRFLRKKVILNVDGLDWQREKWNNFAKKFLKFSEYISVLFPVVTLTDSKTVQSYYRTTYKKEILYLPYFVNIVKTQSAEVLKEYNLFQNKYILFVGRLEPENNAHKLVEVYQSLKTEYKLVIVGDAPYSRQYIAQLKKQESSNIIFTGYLFQKAYQELSSHAYFFVLPGKAGGTRVVLLEQMALGNCILVNNSENNLEVVGDCAYAYAESENNQELKDSLQYLLSEPGIVEEYREKAKLRLRDKYSFGRVIKEYEKLLLK